MLQPDGERSIIMASGATSLITSAVMQRCFLGGIGGAQMITTEISQVPLSGVRALLDAARASRTLSVLDVDVAPNVAVNEARLGSVDELRACIAAATVLKPAKHAAQDLVAMLDPQLSVAV